MGNKIFNTKGFKWAMHVLVWAVILLIPYIFTPDHGPQHHGGRPPRSEFRTMDTITNFFWIALFYINALVLTPKFIYRRKIAAYVAWLLLSFCIIIGFHDVIFYLLYSPRRLNFGGAAMHNILPFLFTIAVSTTYESISARMEADKAFKEKQNEHLKTELSFLRSQMSPHFLFNVLNNIAALARIKSDELEPTIMKLSSLMRYMLYETDEDKVVVKNEAEYIQDYIDLQKQRFGDELTLKVQFEIEEEWQTIEPMLLIPFAENAFKHGGGLIRQPEIDIYLKVDKDRLQFVVKNRFEESTAIKDKTSGIGLANVKRRLELLYPDKHVLKTDSKDGWFEVNLELKLK